MIHLLDKLDAGQLAMLILFLAAIAGLTIASVFRSVSKIFTARHQAPVAQRTERLATDQQAGGSTPPGRTFEDM